MADLRLPAGYHRTTAGEDVIEEAAAHLQAVSTADSGRAFASAEDYANFWRAPFIDLDHDLVLLRDDAGVLVAQALVMSRSPHTDPSAFAVVSPDHRDRGVGSALIAWEEARAMERAAEAPDGARVVLQAFCDAHHEPSLRLLEDHRFAPDRYFMTMEVERARAPRERRSAIITGTSSDRWRIGWRRCATRWSTPTSIRRCGGTSTRATR
jgi:GNAT superfamily N-acetyltransferase